MIDRTLYAEDIAERLRVDVSTARRWLADLERKYGSAIVGRKGRTLYTTDTSVARVRPAWCAATFEISLLHRLADRCGRMWRRITALATDLQEVKGRLGRVFEELSEIHRRLQRLERA